MPVLFVMAILVGGYALFIEGFKDLIKFEFSMATLMTIAIIGATLIGDFAEGAVVVILFAISEMLEGYAAERARQSISTLVNVAPKVATVRRNELEQTIAVQEIQINDIMIIKPGQKIAMDGVVIKVTQPLIKLPLQENPFQLTNEFQMKSLQEHLTKQVI
jgi:Cd2+/Zn2+-exporting ATPase